MIVIEYTSLQSCFEFVLLSMNFCFFACLSFYSSFVFCIIVCNKKNIIT